MPTHLGRPLVPTFFVARAEADEKTGRKALAIKDYRTGQRRAPNDPDYAVALERLGATP